MAQQYVIDTVHKIARKSAMKVQVGALLIKRNKVIGIGYNSLKRGHIRTQCTEYKACKYSIHAEQACINNCDKKKLKGATLVLIKLSQSGKIINGEPCRMCKDILKKYKIEKVITVKDV